MFLLVYETVIKCNVKDKKSTISVSWEKILVSSNTESILILHFWNLVSNNIFTSAFVTPQAPVRVVLRSWNVTHSLCPLTGTCWWDEKLIHHLNQLLFRLMMLSILTLSLHQKRLKVLFVYFSNLLICLVFFLCKVVLLHTNTPKYWPIHMSLDGMCNDAVHYFSLPVCL